MINLTLDDFNKKSVRYKEKKCLLLHFHPKGGLTGICTEGIFATQFSINRSARGIKSKKRCI